jgi:hypothetical protein
VKYNLNDHHSNYELHIVLNGEKTSYPIDNSDLFSDLQKNSLVIVAAQADIAI